MSLARPRPASVRRACLLAGLTLVAAAPASALDCASDRSMLPQADLTTCAFQDFEAANADQVEALRGYTTRLSGGDQTRWRDAQKAWLAWRTAQCRFESGAIGQGSARQMVYWRCVVRLTQERTAVIARLATCPEGDLACPPRRP